DRPGRAAGRVPGSSRGRDRAAHSGRRGDAMSRASLTRYQQLELAVADARDSLDEGIHLVLMSYQPNMSADADTLMSALSNLACARGQLYDVTQQLRGYGDEAEASAAGDDEPSAGDVAEAEASDIRDLANALQTKARST